MMMILIVWVASVAVLLTLYPPASKREMEAGYDRVVCYLQGGDPDA